MVGELYSRGNLEDSSISALLEGLGTAERLDLKGLLPWFYHRLGECYRLSHQLTLAEYYDRKFYDVVSVAKK